MSQRRRILGATVTAFGAAALALVTFVLPAEYGLDPVGTGRALGLLALAEPAGPTVVEEAPGPWVPDTVSFELEPFESMEYKFRLEAGASLVFAWHATGDVISELHAEPDGAPAGYAESYRKGRGVAYQGTYRAAFPGWHGWFWENRNPDPVTLTLEAAGFFTAARTYRGGFVDEQPIGEP